MTTESDRRRRPWSKPVEEALPATGWANLDEVTLQVAHLIPSGQAFRTGMRIRNQGNKEWPVKRNREPYTEAELIWFGKRQMVRDVLESLVRRGIVDYEWEGRGPLRAGRWRRRKTKLEEIESICTLVGGPLADRILSIIRD